MSIHPVDTAEFQYGDYEVTLEIEYWESLPTQNGKESYVVEMNARSQSSNSTVTFQNSAPFGKKLAAS